MANELRSGIAELFRARVLCSGALLSLSFAACQPSQQTVCGKLPGANQDEIQAYVDAGCFRDLPHDPSIRSSGPIILRHGQSRATATHNRVRVYYSPGMVAWLRAGRPPGGLPDGEVVIKELFPSDTTKPGADDPEGYATMVRDAKGSADGWYWSSYITLKDDPRKPIGKAGWSDCLLCHSSADNPENTFAAVEHLDGTIQEPQYFLTDPASWPPVPLAPMKLPAPLAQPDAHFVALFDQKLQPGDPQSLALPSQLPNDHAVAKPPVPDPFLTSDSCSGCHSARLSNITGLNMMVIDANGRARNVSQFGEWSASLMGLAGRDPVFHAQLESEKALRPAQAAYLDNTCYRCHGVMGQRQLALDKQQPFQHDMVYATGTDPSAKYGALARDGVSCTVCHHISPEGLGSEAQFTGKFLVGPSTEVYGPDDDSPKYSMKTGLGVEPKRGTHLGTAAMCGSCHSVILPKVPLDITGDVSNDPSIQYGHEQSTYLEWRNSVYQDEREPIVRAEVKTCQGCHMPSTYDGNELKSRVANIEDSRYPAVPNRAPDDQITLKERSGFARHTLLGANQFALRIFAQFSDLLGVSTYNPYGYNGTEIALLTAADEGIKLAQKQTATVELKSAELKSGMIESVVSVTNHAGHKFPSGVNFRRAFLEFAVLDAGGNVLWASGRTNGLGQLVDASGKVLDTEMSRTTWQPHYDIITRQDQAQIYEKRNTNQQGELTTSFLDLFVDVKDNRLLPKGWRLDLVNSSFMQPVGIHSDPRYADGSGADEITYRIPLSEAPKASSVRATLYYQSLPPYYLRDRFTTAHGKETQRLYYLTSHLMTKDTPIKDWKLMIGAAAAMLQ